MARVGRGRAVIIVLIVAVFIWLAARGYYFPRVDAGFATSASLRFHYGSKAIDARITDANDLRVLKETLRGRIYPDNPSCGFTTDTSITLTDGRRSITFCPACDGDAPMRIGESQRYLEIPGRQRKRLDTVLSKYGMSFPCE